MNKKLFIIPVGAVLLCSLLLFTMLDSKVMDLFQRTLPSTELSKNVQMVNVDDASVANIGSWPFSRDVYASALETMRDLDTGSVVFDLSFFDKSPAKVDESYVTETLPSYIDEDVSLATQTILNYLQYSDSTTDGDIKEQIEAIINNAKDNILISTSYVLRPLDGILAQGMNYFGNTYCNFTLQDTNAVNEPDSYFTDQLPLTNIEVLNDTKTPEYPSVLTSLPLFLENCKNSGFVNADPDKDGFTRRVHLVVKYDGKYYGQLVFIPILDYFGNPTVQISNKAIVLKDAKLPDGTVKDIKIPRDRYGSVLIKFPKVKYVEYNSTNLWNIYRISNLEAQLADEVAHMEDDGLFSFLDTENPYDLSVSMNYIKSELRNGEDPENEITYENYQSYRARYYDALTQALSEDYKNYVLMVVEGDAELEEFVEQMFAHTVAIYKDLTTSIKEQRALLENSMCIIGTNSTSTTDYGLILYEEHYPNPGVHYSVANQLIAQDFLADSPDFISIIYAFVLCMLLFIVSSRLKGTSRKIVIGLSFTAFSVLSLLLFFVITRTYVGAIVPLTSTFITFILLTIIGFISESRGKKFITNAFGQCLSKEVVKEIVEHPESFKLGGQKLEMTAIFTDIQKFSSFSELLSASQLVALLNYYLTKMSDIIMDERGTVDKYEGDAIIALVGAPVKMEDHALRAVRAALQMKKSEEVMNQEIKAIAEQSKPEEMDEELYNAFDIMVNNNKTIFTRIGINSGEMIAGYMGSENKKNYTMMGNNVNLASRLEGVNKQYSTGGILISESTKKLLNDEVIVRRLDKVQVVNVNTPLRLYEPLGLNTPENIEISDYAVKWEEAMDLFELNKFTEALIAFKALQTEKPEDKVAAYYIKLIETFFMKGTYPKEADGVGVAYNPELKAFKLLQK